MKQIKIQKFIVCIAIVLMQCLVSCKNDAVEISRENAKINILLNNVLSPFTAYTQKNMDMYKEDGVYSKIVVRAFVYDDAGHLINKFSKEISDYKQGSVSFTTSLTGSNPQIVCLTYATLTSSSGIKYDAYNISGEELLSTLKIENDYASSVDYIPWQVLGGAIISVGTASEKVDIEVKPLGGLVYLDWHNIHAHDGELKAPQRYVFMQKYNDIATINNGAFSFSSSLSSRYYFVADVFPSDFPTYDWVYGLRFMFPSTVESYCYGAYSPSNYTIDNDEEMTGTSSHKNIQVDAGKQYLFKMDCKTYELDVKEGVLVNN